MNLCQTIRVCMVWFIPGCQLDSSKYNTPYDRDGDRLEPDRWRSVVRTASRAHGWIRSGSGVVYPGPASTNTAPVWSVGNFMSALQTIVDLLNSLQILQSCRHYTGRLALIVTRIVDSVPEFLAMRLGAIMKRSWVNQTSEDGVIWLVGVSIRTAAVWLEANFTNVLWSIVVPAKRRMQGPPQSYRHSMDAVRIAGRG